MQKNWQHTENFRIGNNHGIYPVSYTHLDVYKRQVQFGMGVSVAPIDTIRQTNTNKAGVQEGKNAGMAPLAYRLSLIHI